MKARMIISALCAILAVAYGQLQHPDAVPHLINYQGFLCDTSAVPVTDSVDITFAIFNSSTGGNQLWSETQSNISIERGIFNALLGAVNAIPDSVFRSGVNRWLELTVGGQSLSPRTRITAAAYAYNAVISDTAAYARTAAADADWTISGNDMYAGVSGGVGIGTSLPGKKLDVAGDIQASGQLISQTTGAAPLAVANNTLVANLNADFVDGKNGANLTDRTANETITGSWTFNNAVTVGAPSAAAHAMRKSDVNPLCLDGQVGIIRWPGSWQRVFRSTARTLPAIRWISL